MRSGIADVLVNTNFWLVLFTAILALATGGLVIVRRNTDTALKETARAAKDANELNSVGLRPWVDFDLVDIASGITVNREQVIIKIKYSMKNTGRLPAMMTNVNFEMQPIMVGRQDFGEILAKEQIRVCTKS